MGRIWVYSPEGKVGCGKEGECPEEGEERVRGNAHEVMPTVRGRRKTKSTERGKVSESG